MKFTLETGKKQENTQKQSVYTPIIGGHEKAEPTMVEALKGKVEDNKLKFGNDLDIVEHPFPMGVTEGLYSDFGLVKGIVDKFVDFMLGPGFWVSSTDPRAEEIIKTWIRDVNFDTLLRVWVKRAFLNGTSFMELGGKEDEVPQGIKVLDSKRMFIRRDDTGKTLGYAQVSRLKGNIASIKKDTIPFKPFEIAHLAFDPVADCPYGLGIVWPTMSYIDSLMGNEKSMRTIMRRKANSQIVARLGDVAGGEMPTQESVDAFAAKMEHMTDKTEWAVDAFTNIEVLDFGKIGEKFEFPIEHDVEMISGSVQIPQVLLGKGSIPEGLAQVQMDGFERSISSKQVETEKVVEQDIFRRILTANGFGNDVHVEFNWGQPSTADKTKRMETVREILKIPGLSLEMIKALELELASLLGFNVEEIKSAQDQRREEEEKNPQPSAPGQNRDEQMLHESTCPHCTEKENGKDHTLTEWLGFNFSEFVKDIRKVVMEDKFELVKAKNLIEEKAGKFSEKQVEALRRELDIGFKESKTIKEIEKGIAENVKPNDLLRMEDGEIVTRDGSPVLQVAGSRRSILIARTETTRMASEGARQNYEKGGVEEYQWVSSIGERTCPQCETLNGLTFKISEAPFMPPQHGMCRCSIIPVIKL